MVSVGVSALGRTIYLHFVDPSVKVNGQYYRDILLRRDLLPDIKQYSDYFTLKMLTSYDDGLMRNGTSWNSA